MEAPYVDSPSNRTPISHDARFEVTAGLTKQIGSMLKSSPIPLPAIAYTQADADACTPDAMRLCASAVPDVRRVAFCLAHNKQQLNSACAAVFNRSRGVSATRERRENSVVERLLCVANERVRKRLLFSPQKFHPLSN